MQWHYSLDASFTLTIFFFLRIQLVDGFDKLTLLCQSQIYIIQLMGHSSVIGWNVMNMKFHTSSLNFTNTVIYLVSIKRHFTIPYSGKFSEGKIFGNQAINWISEINFRNQA